ncbi:hypothetical protein TNCV_4648061 [Trichonephila clavipes]|uniref:Uncharacterized protein n=1 Tax=Trichonephila clavipes TaxID=2585209 RepID=A0A8X6STC5_TRICX|nr:hypothetical protein TNCV_4648061 [Trichonephila clavipes]
MKEEDLEMQQRRTYLKERLDAAEKNKKTDDKIYPIDDNITNTLEDFLSHPPPLPIAPTNPDEITNYSTNQEAPSQSRPLHFKAQIPFDMGWRNVSRSVSQRCQASQ